MLCSGFVLDALHLRKHSFLTKECGVELLCARLDTEEVQQRLVVYPVNGRVLRRAMRHLIIAGGKHEQISLAPLNLTVLGRNGFARSSDDVESLRGSCSVSIDLLVWIDADEGS